ncbi:hypothetical protein PR202_ga19774 [Eleusine coracana subsp. coracana]|uniref:Uncharacterized protein n=1 Tax=Eleusine coracana subsp. coracana TaxID=191504 RepID=A0AAV5CVN0_ELECO|nr:hypothetical protein PR202_ga19774 [Eleusine coracana subsp. coracana]
MAEDAPASAPSMTPEDVHAEAELRLRDIGQRLGTLPQDKDELLGLLEEAETWLVRLNQEKTSSTPGILSPIKGILISRDLLDHPNPDVKLAITSCLTEVTRLTAPDSPYDNDVMKEVFQRIVDTFADLGDINSPSYEKRVSILDTVASVRCCILMLDLNMDHLILDMFHHLFKAACKNHSKSVIQCMETIFRVVIEESDDIHSELALCLLQNLTKEAQGTLSESFGLAERLVGLCKDRLKPVFARLLRGNPLDNYSNVVTLLCQDASNVVADNNLDAPGIIMAGEGEIIESTVSEETPQETSKLVQDVHCPGQDDTHPDIAPTVGINSGGTLGDNDKCPDSSPSSEQKPKLLSRGDQAEIEQLISCDNEVSEPVISEAEKPSDVNSKRSQKLDSSSGSEMTDHSKVKDKESLVAAEALSPETDHGDNNKLIESGKKVETPHALIKKRGRPPAAKSQGKKTSRTKQGSGLNSEKVDPVSDSGRIITRQKTKEDAKSSSNNVAEGESVMKQQKYSLKLQNKDFVSDKDADVDSNLKVKPFTYIVLWSLTALTEMVSATETDKTKDQQEDSGVSKRKHLQEAEGVAYDDGDVEMLQLKKERWEFTDDEQDSYPDAASDMPHGRRGKGSSSLQMEGGKTGTPQCDGGNPPKRRGRPKGVCSNNSKSNAYSSANLGKVKGKGARKDIWETPEPGRRITRSTAKAEDDGVKASNKDKAGSTKNAEESNDKAGNEDNTSDNEVKSSEAVDGSKTYSHSTKRKFKEQEDESSEEKAPAKASTGKKLGRKSRK